MVNVLRHSAIASCQDLHQFRDLTALLLLVAARDRMFDAMGNVIPQNFSSSTFRKAARTAEICVTTSIQYRCSSSIFESPRT